MPDTLKVYADNDSVLLLEIAQALQGGGVEVQRHVRRKRGIPDVTVLLSSKSIFVRAYEIIRKVMEGHKNREVTIEVNGAKVCIKDHSFPEEMELLQKFFPETSVKMKTRKIRGSATSPPTFGSQIRPP